MKPSLRGEEWGYCYICGELFPMSLLSPKTGTTPSGKYSRTDPNVVILTNVAATGTPGTAMISSTAAMGAAVPATDETPKGICAKCRDEE